jgi:hypothetical protein
VVNPKALTISYEYPAPPIPLPDGAKKVCACGGGNWIRISPTESFQVPHNMSHPVHTDR